MGTKFDDSFWVPDFNGTSGFDSLCKRMRDGQKVCHDIIEFFKKRSKADLQYSKTLRGISKTADGKEEIGDLGLSWQAMKDKTEKTAKFHEIASTKYNQIADELLKFMECSKTEIKLIEERVKDRQKIKKNAHGKMTECQKTYHEKCRDMMSFKEQLETCKMSVSSSAKDVEKLKIKAERSQETMEKSDAAYKQAVETLEHSRENWEADMEDGCKNFHRLEEERIYYLRDNLWKCTNIDSQLCVDRDESCEIVRLCLETCDVQKEMVNFINIKKTGTVRPAPIEYSNYFDSQGKNASASPRTPRRKMYFEDDAYADVE